MKTSTFMLFYCCICTTEGKQKRVSTYSGRLFPNNTCLSISFSFLTTQWRIVWVYGTSKQPRLILCWTLMSHFKDLSNVRRFYPCLHFLDILILQHINNVHLLTCWQFLKNEIATFFYNVKRARLTQLRHTRHSYIVPEFSKFICDK